MRTAIIGAGAAGAAAAIAAARNGERVLLLERNAKPFKKLGVTGNGRCNLMNTGSPVYYGDADFARDTLRRVPASALRAFFDGLGVPLREEGEGRVYPAALAASAVTDALKAALATLPVEWVPSAKIADIAYDGGFSLTAEDGRAFAADRVIVAAGGMAAPAHGTDGAGYPLLARFGHTLVAPKPALCALKTAKRPLEGLAGQRVRARLTLENGRETAGEALFGEDAISGIAAMQLARFAEPGMALALDLRPALCFEGDEPALAAALRALAGRRSGLRAGDLLAGWFAAPVGRALLRAARIDPAAPIESADCRALARAICGWRFTLTGTRGFEQAQVTAGGAPCAEFVPGTLESRLRPGLYAAGEVLDVDGDCGGFNLMFAFASGLLAGKGGKA